MSGLLPQVVDDDIISLQYADDSSLFLEDDIEKEKNPKWLLICYEHMTGMKINYDKVICLLIGFEEDRENEFTKIFCCKREREIPHKIFRCLVSPYISQNWKGTFATCD